MQEEKTEGPAGSPPPSQPSGETAPAEEERKKAEAKPAEKKSITSALQSAVIALDTYDDIFSDFDPSPFETRILSDDFLIELGRRYAETQKGELTVTFTIPGSLRSEKIESLVKKRIRDYFKARYAKALKQVKGNQKSGIIRVAAGVIVALPIVFFPALAALNVDPLLSVVSWYLVWTGLDRLLEVPGKLSSELNFCDRFHKAKYTFVSEEEVLRSKSISSSYR